MNLFTKIIIYGHKRLVKRETKKQLSEVVFLLSIVIDVTDY